MTRRIAAATLAMTAALTLVAGPADAGSCNHSSSQTLLLCALSTSVTGAVIVPPDLRSFTMDLIAEGVVYESLEVPRISTAKITAVSDKSGFQPRGSFEFVEDVSDGAVLKTRTTMTPIAGGQILIFSIFLKNHVGDVVAMNVGGDQYVGGFVAPTIT